MAIDNSLLVKLASKGDGDAFARLYSLYAHDMYRFASYMLNSPDDAEDAVQSAVLTAYSGIASLRKPQAFKSWLFKILSNECKRILRQRGKAPDALPEDDYFFSLKDENASQMPLGVELAQAVRELPPPDGQIVLMCVIGGFKSEELSAVFGIPAATVRSKLSRSLAKLRTRLTDSTVQ